MYKLITDYYEQRGLKWPQDADEALDWALTELAEAKELLLDRKGGWTRNNPGNKTPFQPSSAFAEELGDIIMMVLVAGIVEGVEPLTALTSKIKTQTTGDHLTTRITISLSPNRGRRHPLLARPAGEPLSLHPDGHPPGPRSAKRMARPTWTPSAACCARSSPTSQSPPLLKAPAKRIRN